MAIRSTPLRLTVTLVAILVLSSLASFFAAYWVIRGQLDAVLREELVQVAESYRGIPTETEIEERIARDTRTIDPELTLVRYIPAAGEGRGNILPIVAFDGFRVLDAARIFAAGDDPADTYLAYGMPLGQGHLVVARGREQIAELWQTMTGVFFLSLIPTVVVVSGAGLLLGRSARKRVEGIRLTLRRLAEGDLDARVANLAGADDDLAQIGVAVNRMALAQSATIESLRQVSADIAHDLKTPLQARVGAAPSTRGARYSESRGAPARRPRSGRGGSSGPDVSVAASDRTDRGRRGSRPFRSG